MVGKRELDQRDESGEAALPRRHLLAHHPRVAVAEQENQSAVCDGAGTNLGSALDGVELCLTDFL